MRGRLSGAVAMVALLAGWLMLGVAGSPSARAATPPSARPATPPSARAATPPPPWHTQALPGTAPGIQFYDVSCSSATFCMAVGDQYIQGEDYEYSKVVAEAWNGTVWRPVPMANPKAGPSEGWFFTIASVSCVSPTSCVAVGNIEGRIILHTLAEVWDGTSWQTTTATNGGNEPTLQAVSCVTAKDCIAVGSYTRPGAPDSNGLAEQWNGKTWTRILHSSTGLLSQVSCPSASLCFAGGQELSGLDRWNGTGWTNVERGKVTAALLSCATTHSCLAVGCPNPSTCGRIGPQNSFAWNGSTWRQATTNGAKRQNLLESLSCVSATSCTAVGGLTGDPNAVAGRWNGRYWTLQRDPGGAPGLTLGAVSCVGTACEAMGGVPVPHNYAAPTAVRSS